ncbi:Peroxidase 65 [Turnera subulata]|uniref:Peroxidase n=1 Tax=Turnera subulata TaxID=218843 RepID=A0A9Q0FXM4_9ROSI|nr:Peroxidase 65 [Turnera subulata]
MVSSSPLLLLLLLPILVVASLPAAPLQSQLSLDYYKKTCPQFEKIVGQVITEKQLGFPSTAAGVVRLFFHDCMVEGCDASLLISSNSFNKAERDHDINVPLPGDAFDVIARAKTALELECPGVVSCSDILATAARDLVVMVGGPHYQVVLGRKDGLVSHATSVQGHLATPKMSIQEIISLFQSRGYTVQEMVALVGAHTIGFSHCKEFSDRLFNFSKTSKTDPALNPKYADGLKKLCENYTTDPTMSAYNDVMTPGKFDNMYFRNLKRGLGLLASDQALAEDERTKPFVELYAENETAFFKDFAKAMEKTSLTKIKTEKDGDVRRRCDQFNEIKH